MAKITWEKGSVPVNMEVRQVYGIFFDRQGRVLLRIEKGKYKLTGGKPDENDPDYYATLRRELREEANCLAGDLRMVGYQKVDDENGAPAYAQIRMAGIIEEIGEAKPDPDRPECVYGRVFVSPLKAAVLLNWGQVGINQIYDAAVEVQTHLDIKVMVDDMLVNEENKLKWPIEKEEG